MGLNTLSLFRPFSLISWWYVANGGIPGHLGPFVHAGFSPTRTPDARLYKPYGLGTCLIQSHTSAAVLVAPFTEATGPRWVLLLRLSRANCRDTPVFHSALSTDSRLAWLIVFLTRLPPVEVRASVSWRATRGFPYGSYPSGTPSFLRPRLHHLAWCLPVPRTIFPTPPLTG